jgi:threonine/homoserine/homoserine lactone efflux protein
MTDYHFLIGIAPALLLGVMSPGPSFICVVKASVSTSRCCGFAVALGMGVGTAIFSLLALSGLHIVFTTVPKLYLALKIAGGLYLCVLAYKMWRGAKRPLIAEEDIGTHRNTMFRSFALGLFTQLSNPKTAVVIAGIFAALLPAHITGLMFVLIPGLAFIIDTGWYLLVAYALSSKVPRDIYLKYKAPVSYCAGGIMGLLGLKLITFK